MQADVKYARVSAWERSLLLGRKVLGEARRLREWLRKDWRLRAIQIALGPGPVKSRRCYAEWD